MPTLFNPNRRKGIFMIPSGATKSPTPTPPAFQNIYSLSFDGVDDYVDCGTELGNSFGVTTNISISMWINPSVTSGNDLFFNIGSFSNSFGQIAFQLLSNKLYVKLNNGARSYNVAYTNTTDWQHLVFVYDGSNSANTKMHINNVEQSTTAAGVFPSSLDLSNLKTIIGAGYSVSYTYSGLQDEVAIFNSSLTSANVTSIYNSGVPNDISSISGLSAWYRNGDNGSYKSPQWLIPNNSNVANSRFSNYSFSYDGVDDYVDTGISTLTGTDLSISYWFKTTATLSNFNYYVPFSAVSNQQFVGAYLYYHPTTKLTFRSRNSSGTLVKGTVDLSDGNWHNIVVTYDSTSYALKMYVDGSIDYDETIYSYAVFNQPLLLGGKSSSLNLIDCSIDEASLFNSVLTSENVTAIYNSGVPNDISLLSPVGYWRSENSTFSTNWTVTDNGSGSSDGTSANMTIEDRVGNASNSSNNAVSFNMTESDREEDTPS